MTLTPKQHAFVSPVERCWECGEPRSSHPPAQPKAPAEHAPPADVPPLPLVPPPRYCCTWCNYHFDGDDPQHDCPDASAHAVQPEKPVDSPASERRE